MAATVLVERWTGAGAGAAGDITSVTTRCKCADNGTVDTNNPIPIPAAGTNYSWWVSTRLHVTGAPAGTINNLKWYTDAGNGFGTGVTCKAQVASTGANDGYRQATTGGGCGTQLTQANHTGMDAAPTDCFGFTSGAALAVVGSITATTGYGTPAFGFVVYQLEVGTTAGPGATGSETFTHQYDET